MIKPRHPKAGNHSGLCRWSLARQVTVPVTASLLLVLGLLSLAQPDTGHASPVDAAGTVGTLLLLALTSRRRHRHCGRHRRSTKDGVR